MEITDTHRYQRGVESVYPFFTDPTQLKARYEKAGSRNVQILESVVRGGEHLVRTQREIPAEVPGVLKKFFGAWNRVVQTDHWRGSAGSERTCDFEIEVAGAPVQIHGSMRLRPEGQGCVNEVRMAVSCGIPLVGKKIVELTAASSRKGMAADYAYISRAIETTPA